MKNKKSLGQHWLKDREVLKNIAQIAANNNQFSDEASPCLENQAQGERRGAPKSSIRGAGRGECVPSLILEIGPGLGTLTSALFLYFKKVIAVEFDPDLAAKLPSQFPGKDLTVIHADILDFDLSTIPTPYVAAGNIPYYITAPIIRKFLTAANKPTRLTLLIQKEVAERLAAGPGDYSILGLTAQIYAKVSLGPVVKRDLFTPPPKVDSQVVILEPYATPLASESVIKLIKLGFSSPRKKLKNNLNLPDGTLTSLHLPETARPADLTLENWISLAELPHS